MTSGVTRQSRSWLMGIAEGDPINHVNLLYSIS